MKYSPQRQTFLQRFSIKVLPGKLFFLGFISVFILGCEVEQPVAGLVDGVFVADLPPGIPPMPLPEDNPMTTRKIELGRRLFYDPILSRDSSISCGSCHKPEFAMADRLPVSEGFEGRMGKRNAPALFNLAWHEAFNHDGGTPSVELQLLVPIEDANEMNFSIREAVDRLEQHPEYRSLFRGAFQAEPGAFELSRALSAFERSLISFGSPYDRFRFYGENEALSEPAKRGLELFESDSLNCSSCHGNFDLRKNGYENNGLYSSYPDSGRAGITLNPVDAGRFKVPSLRNVALSGPYMFDGSLATLSDVVDHYAGGGAGHPNQNPLVGGFSLSSQEKDDLLAFLNALTDESFPENPDIQPGKY